MKVIAKATMTVMAVVTIRGSFRLLMQECVLVQVAMNLLVRVLYIILIPAFIIYIRVVHRRHISDKNKELVSALKAEAGADKTKVETLIRAGADVNAKYTVLVYFNVPLFCRLMRNPL
jgi:hypothetical protein